MVLRMTYTTDAPTDDRWLTTGEVADLLSYSRKRVHQWVKSGALKATRPGGGHYRIRWSDVVAFMDASPDNQ